MKNSFRRMRRTEKRITGRPHIIKLRSLLQKQTEEEQSGRTILTDAGSSVKPSSVEERLSKQKRNPRRKRSKKGDDDTSISGIISVISTATTVKAGCCKPKKIAPTEETPSRKIYRKDQHNQGDRRVFWRKTTIATNNLSAAALQFANEDAILSKQKSKKEIPLTMKRYLWSHETNSDRSSSTTYSHLTSTTAPSSSVVPLAYRYCEV
mmetsp:Transcript_29968/g.42513  ORF Transcript_29968/g.42513 Transcript_29968/m.42513 type:complete len:208 (+) Transcript_29968:65-688(+)|eukprot:CAMPEP_0202441584 /NCGR_PEP_ID=MMETSP1360-20130828/1119_1 /ASSEMBLY_ACC=CAM_ASM_000848 /TAXON_ID=515479 /ORGANISM="Licmophora paradoxa, Strain CCMP2313" /LENGTH=207 /DNA_ID=CAMNT_0049056639 /DNA_START=65 /DNA_END=688 /DNA_ORIENTATION=+